MPWKNWVKQRQIELPLTAAMGTLLAVMKRLFPITPSLAEHLQEVGRNIRVARLRHGISAELVAEFAGISRPTLRAVERGRASVAIGAYARVMEIIWTPPDGKTCSV